MQDDIAAAITGALRVKLTPNRAPIRPREPNLAAYEAFLKAKHQFPTKAGMTTEEASDRAEQYFKQAIALDSQWADPHAELSRQHFFLGLLGLRPLNEMVPLARAEARTALEIVPYEPTALAVLGAIAGSHDYDWNEADQQFRRARASGSLPPAVHDLYATSYLLPLGRLDEAIEQQAKAVAADPLNMLWRARHCIPLLWAEMYERAIAEARKVVEFDERDVLSNQVIALGEFFQGRRDAAREAAEQAFRLAPWGSGAAGFLAGLLRQMGETERADKLIGSMRGITSVGMIFYHLVCSDIDSAIDWYERAIEERELFAAQLASAGFTKSLRSSPRWRNLAKMMKLPGTT